MIISSRNKKKSQGNIFLGSQNKILEKRKINMICYIAASLRSYLRAWELYKIEEGAEDLVITEADYNKMIEVIRALGLEEKVDERGVHRWYGTREEILRTVNAIEFSTHAGPSFEDYDDEMFEEMLWENPDSERLPYLVGKA
jgi:hypothetical protein